MTDSSEIDDTDDGHPSVMAPATAAGAAVVRAAVGEALAALQARPERDPSSDDGRDEREQYDGPPAGFQSDPAGGDKPAAAKRGKPPANVKRALLDHTDVGIAERLEFYAKGRLVFCGGLGGWAAFDGQRFDAQDGTALAHREVLALRDKMKSKEYVAMKDWLDDDLDHDESAVRKRAREKLSVHWKAAIALGNIRKQSSILAQASVLDPFLTSFETLDADGHLINTAAGVLALPLTLRFDEVGLTAEDQVFEQIAGLSLRKCTPDDRITRVCGSAPDLDELRADKEDLCPNWTSHIKKIFPKDVEKQRLFQRMCGSMLVAHNPNNRWFILQGRGGDGKSVTMRAIQHALGDYFRTGAIESLLYDPRRSAGGTREDLMRLVGGTRVVMFPEPSRKDILDDGFIKKASGGEEISARSGYGKQDEYRPDFKMVLMCNPLPKVQGNDDGFWRRPILIRFPKQFTKSEQDPDIDRKLAAEATGIFNWMIEGFLDWWSKGFQFEEPDAVKADLNTYRRQSSPMEAWAQDRLIFGGWWNRDKLNGDFKGLRDEIRDGNEESIQRARDMGLTTSKLDEFPAPGYAPRADIYEDFSAWCEESGLEPWRPNGFSNAWAEYARANGCWDKRHGVKGRGWFGFDFKTGGPLQRESKERDEMFR